MSTPLPITRIQPYNPYESATWDEEWDRFLAARKQVMDEIMGRLDANKVVGQIHPNLDFQGRQAMADALMAASRPEPTPRSVLGMLGGQDDGSISQSQLNDLIGAAEFYGVPNADKIPPEALAQIIDAKRLSMRSGRNGEPLPADMAAATVAGALGVGALDTLVGVAQHVPFLGDFLAKKKFVQEADQWLAMYNEGISADLTSEERRAYGLLETGGGATLGYLVPGELIWRAAGAAGALPFIAARGARLGPIARTAIQAGATSWGLEGGGDRPLLERMALIGIGAGFGAVFGAAASLLKRTQQAFPGSGKSYHRGANFDEPTPPPSGQDVTDLAYPRGLPEGMPEADFTVINQQTGSALVRTQPAAGPSVEPYAAPGILPSGPSPARGGGVAPAEALADKADEIADAVQEGIAISKHATIIESPIVPELARQPVIDDFDVARAALATNPGQINVIRNVGDVAKTVRQLTQAQVEKRLMPHTFRVVEREITDAVPLGVTEGRLSNYFRDRLSEASIDPDLVDMSLVRQYGPGSDVVYFDAMIKTAEAVGPSHPQFDRLDVIRSNLDIAKTMAPTEVPRFKLEKTKQYDILISDGLPITPKRVEQYKEFGLYEGQRAVTVDGMEVVVKAPGEVTTIYSPYSKQEYQVWAHEILPGRASFGGIDVPIPDAPAIYNQMRQAAMREMVEESSRAGIPVFDWLSPETSSQLPRLIESFLDAQGITNPTTRATLRSYFDVRRVEDFKAATPAEDAALQQSILNEVQVANRKARLTNPDTPRAEEVAQSKGFVLVRTGPTSAELRDELSDLVIPVESDDAAVAALREIDRELPDVGPESDIPLEVIEPVPGVNPGNAVEPLNTAESYTTAYGISYDEIVGREFDNIAGAGGAGSGGVPPQPPTTGALGGGEPGGFLPGPRTLPEQFAIAAREKPQQLHEVIAQLNSAWLRYGTPFRDLTIRLQNDFQALGIDQGRLWQHYNDVVTNSSVAHNESLPWLEEWNSIMSQFRREFLRKGVVTRVQEIQGPPKVNEMIRLGYTEREIAAQNRIQDFNDRIFRYMLNDPAFEVTADAYINSYMSHLRKGGSAASFESAEGILPHHLRFFAEMARTGSVNVREMDARVLGHSLIRAIMFKKHVAPAWEQMAQAWDQPGIPEHLRTMVKGWLQTVQRGYDPGYDVAIHGLQHTANKLGIPLTEADARNLWGNVFTNMYRSALGLRPDVWFRDAIQPLLAGVDVGFQPIAQAYKSFLNPATRPEMWERALKHGWVEVGQVQTANSEVFTREIVTEQGVQLLSPQMASRREALAQVGDFIWNVLPPAARSGIQGRVIDPLLVYTKEGMLNRLISGEAGYQLSAQNLAKFSRGEMTFEQLKINAKLGTFEKPFQRRWLELVEGGQHEEAAALMGNELAISQFRYGAKEQPIGIREARTAGRFGMQFGTFTLQYLARMKATLKNNGSIRDVLGKVARYGSMTGALYLAEEATGMKFSRWALHKSLTFLGGPVLETVAQAYTAASGVMAGLSGREPTYQQQGAIGGFTPTGLAADMVESVFPYSGGMRTFQNYMDAFASPTPVRAAIGTTLTGERGGIAPQITNFFENYQVAPAWTPEMGTGGFPQQQADTSLINQLYAPTQPGTPPAVDNGVSDPSRVYTKPAGHQVYDTPNVSKDGRVPTHRLDVPSGRNPGETWEQYEARVHATPEENYPPQAYRTDNSLDSLDPQMRQPLLQLIEAAQRAGVRLSINETYRPPERQELLFKQGRSLPGPVVTWTLTSDHMTRTAADLRTDSQQGYEWLQSNAPDFGFTVLGMMDPGHVAMPQLATQQIQQQAAASAGPVVSGAMY